MQDEHRSQSDMLSEYELQVCPANGASGPFDPADKCSHRLATGRVRPIGGQDARVPFCSTF